LVQDERVPEDLTPEEQQGAAKHPPELPRDHRPRVGLNFWPTRERSGKRGFSLENSNGSFAISFQKISGTVSGIGLTIVCGLAAIMWSVFMEL
jgi:hypothetical protein